MTYAYIALAAAAALSATASVRQGQAVEAQSEYAAAQAEENAKQTRAQTSTMEDEQRARARQVIGAQIAAGAESGTQLSGSASDMLRQSLFNAEADAQQIRYEGETRARGLTSQATASRFEGRNAKKQGQLSAAGTLISAAAQGYGMKAANARAAAAKAGG